MEASVTQEKHRTVKGHSSFLKDTALWKMWTEIEDLKTVVDNDEISK